MTRKEIAASKCFPRSLIIHVADHRSRQDAPINNRKQDILAPDYAASDWQTADEFPMDQVPQGLRGWLSNRGLLTRRMKKHCAGGFSLRVLDQRPASGKELEGGGLCREIALECGPLRTVFARSLVPSDTLAAYPFLGELGDAPLGESMSGLPNLSRDAFSFTVLRPGHALYLASLPPGAEAPTKLFARRARFCLGEHALWVCEVFLPAICHCNPASS